MTPEGIGKVYYPGTERQKETDKFISECGSLRNFASSICNSFRYSEFSEKIVTVIDKVTHFMRNDQKHALVQSAKVNTKY